MIHICKLVWKW